MKTYKKIIIIFFLRGGKIFDNKVIRENKNYTSNLI